MTVERVSRRSTLLGLTIAICLLIVTGSGQALSADNCPTAGDHCNVEATNNPFITWPRGVRSTFVNATGTQAGVGRVGSIDLAHSYSPEYDVEYGWFWENGRNRAQIFRVTVFNGIYNEVDLANIVGIATYTYEIRWYPAVPGFDAAYFSFTAYDSSDTIVPGSHYEDDNPPFSTGTPLTNGERHNLSDSWTTTLDFRNLLRLSSTPAWSSWDYAMCFFDDDPTYQNYTHSSPVHVEVKSGGANC